MESFYFSKNPQYSKGFFLNFFLFLSLLLLVTQNSYAQCIGPPNDCDNDTIINTVDLDDDNDGILDINEGACNSFVGFDWNGQTVSSTVPSTTTSTVNGNLITVNFSGNGWGATNPNLSTGGNARNLFDDGDINGTGAGDDVVLTTRSDNGDVYNIATENNQINTDVVFTIPVNNLKLSFADVDFSDFISIYAIDVDGNTIFPSYTAPSGFTPEWNIYEASDPNNPVSGRRTVVGNGQNTNTSGSTVYVDFNGIFQIKELFIRSGYLDDDGFYDVPDANNNPFGTNQTNSFILAGDYIFCTSTDTDGDNIPDYLDTDSDNDGCFDAIEGGDNILASEVDSNGMLTGTANASTNGVPNNVNTTNGQNVGSSLNAVLFDADGQCDQDGDGVLDANDVCNGSDDTIDSDGDSVPNGCDLDDDNDGILDLDECTSLTENWGTAPWTLNGNLSQTYTDILGPVDMTITTSTSASGSFGGNNMTLDPASGGFAGNTDDIDISFDPAAFQGNSIITIEVTFSEPVFNLSFLITDIDGDNVNTPAQREDRVTILANSGPVTLTAVNALTTGLSVTGNQANPTNSGFVSSNDDSGSVLVNVPDGATTVTIFYEDVSGFDDTLLRDIGILGDLTFCRNDPNDDTDNDGTPNILDTDSDNDGCPDALEANAALNYSDLNPDGSINAPVGSSTDTNPGVPNNTPASSAGTSQNASQQADECDSCNSTSELFTDNDNDTIGDACDVDNDNDGILDSVELRCDQPADANSNSGTGALQDQLYFFNWDGAMFANGLDVGDTQTFNLSSGLQIVATVTSISGNGAGSYLPNDMVTWVNADFAKVYNTPGTSEAFYGDRGDEIDVTMSFVGTKNGNPFPLDLLAFDAEATGDSPDTPNDEQIIFETNGENWEFVETIHTQSGTNGTYTLSGQTLIADETFNTGSSLYVSNNASEIRIQVNHIAGAGFQAFAYGIFLRCDTDNDGIPNNLDTDSDNDGCPDAIEAAGSITQFQLTTLPGGSIAPGSSDNLGTNSDANGSPLLNTTDTVGFVQLSTTAVTDASDALACNADLSLTKTVNNSNPNQGDSITFTITLTNDGPSPTNSIEIRDIIPGDFTYTHPNFVTSQGAVTFNAGTGALTWDLGAYVLTNGSSLTLTYTVTVDVCGEFKNQVEIINSSLFDTDSTPNNNQ